MQTIYKIIAIGTVAALSSITIIGHEIPTLAQTHDSMHMDQMNMGTRGTPPGKFHFLTNNERTALQFYNQGLKKISRDDYKGAIAAFTQVLKFDPNYDMAYVYRGDAHRQLGNYQAAVDDYTKALQTNPNFTYLHNSRGNLREALGDIKGAIEDYTRAIESYPEEGSGYSNRGFATYKLGDTQGAMENLNEAIRINPGYAGGYVNRGKVYIDLGKRTEAIADYQQAKSLYWQQGRISEYLKVAVALKELQSQRNSVAITQ